MEGEISALSHIDKVSESIIFLHNACSHMGEKLPPLRLLLPPSFSFHIFYLSLHPPTSTFFFNDSAKGIMESHFHQYFLFTLLYYDSMILFLFGFHNTILFIFPQMAMLQKLAINYQILQNNQISSFK